MFLNPVNREKYPAYVLFPQCPKDGYWAYSQRPSSFDRLTADEEMPPIFKAVKGLIDSYIANPDIDKKRVYIIGLSMGAMATYDMVIRFPEIFAAAIPICGYVKPDRLASVKDVSFRIFHGDADPVVPVEGSRNAYKALKKAGVDVELYEFPGCDHLSWNPAFNRPDFMEWLFKQKK
jgi:predicted peptidase